MNPAKLLALLTLVLGTTKLATASWPSPFWISLAKKWKLAETLILVSEPADELIHRITTAEAAESTTFPRVCSVQEISCLLGKETTMGRRLVVVLEESANISLLASVSRLEAIYRSTWLFPKKIDLSNFHLRLDSEVFLYSPTLSEGNTVHYSIEEIYAIKSSPAIRSHLGIWDPYSQAFLANVPTVWRRRNNLQGTILIDAAYLWKPVVMKTNEPSHLLCFVVFWSAVFLLL